MMLKAKNTAFNNAFCKTGKLFAVKAFVHKHKAISGAKTKVNLGFLLTVKVSNGAKHTSIKIFVFWKTTPEVCFTSYFSNITKV